MDYSLPGSSIHGILQARILEWVATSFSRGSSRPGGRPRSPALQADSLPPEPPGAPVRGSLLPRSRKGPRSGVLKTFLLGERRERREDGNDGGREERKESTGEYAVVYDFRPRWLCVYVF